MIGIVERVVEALYVSDEDLALPLLRRHQRILIMVQQESKLHATCVQITLLALRGLVRAMSVTENGIRQHGRAHLIKAGLGLARQRCNTGCKRLDIGVVEALQYRGIVEEVLHRRLNEAALS